MPEDKKTNKSVDIEGGPSKETDVNLSDSNDDPVVEKTVDPLEKRTKDIAAREEAVETKLKEISETQEMFRKDWDEKTSELDALKELYDTPNEDLEDVDFEEDGEGSKEDPVVEKDDSSVSDPASGVEFENLVKKEIAEDQAFRNKVLKNQSILNQKFAERELKEDLDTAVESFPKMDKREVLIEVQRDPSQDIMDLAKKSEEDFIAREDSLRETIKTELKIETNGAQEETEKTETIPSEPASDANPSRQVRSKDRWTDAAKKARGDMSEDI